MPRIQYSLEGDAFADGAGGDKLLLDLSEKLSLIYGNQVRQGQIFTVRQVDVRMYNPNTLTQDEVMGVSGKLVYFAPTKNRKLAWKNAFMTWLQNRQALGVKTRGADFRVGLSDGYALSTGLNAPDGVKFNAWINDEEQPLMLASNTEEQDIFGNWTVNHQVTGQTPSNKSFGHWAQKDALTLADDLDFTSEDTQFYALGEASKEAQTVPFQVHFASWFDNGSAMANPVLGQAAIKSFGSGSSISHIDGPLHVMCGLMGVYVDTTTVDDSEFQVSDWGIEISIDVEKWSPILPKKKPRRKSRKGRKGRK